MKEQTGSFDVALRNMIDTLNQGQSSDNPSIASFCKMVLDSWDKERGNDWYVQYMKEESVQRFAEAAKNVKWNKLT